MRAESGPLVKEIYRLTLQLKITDQNSCKSKTKKLNFGKSGNKSNGKSKTGQLNFGKSGNKSNGKSKTGHQFCVEKDWPCEISGQEICDWL